MVLQREVLPVRKIWIPIVSLALAAIVLLGTYNLTLNIRQANVQKELQAKMEVLLPGSTTFTEETYTGDDANIISVHKAENGFVIETVTRGYVDDIRMLIGVSNDGKVTGLVVRELDETFGLGAAALTDTDFLSQFLNTSGEAEVGSTVDALTGATVTSKAITRAVNSAVAYVTGADASSGATSWGG